MTISIKVISISAANQQLTEIEPLNACTLKTEKFNKLINCYTEHATIERYDLGNDLIIIPKNIALFADSIRQNITSNKEALQTVNDADKRATLVLEKADLDMLCAMLRSYNAYNVANGYVYFIVSYSGDVL